MKKQFVTYEIALKLKELGFDEISRFGQETSLYTEEGKHTFYANYGFMGSGLSGGYIYAPLWSQIIDWFREKQNICINIEPITFDDEPTYIFEIINLKNGILLNNINSSFIDSSEALEQAILEVIKITTQNKTI